MRSFKYYAATSWEDAVAFLGKNDKAQVVAGGSDLLGWIKDDLIGPGAPRAEILVDIRTIANTSYDLSGIAALQTTANQMLADQQAGTTAFVGNAGFNAILTPGGATQRASIGLVVAMFAAMTANFDFLDQ